MTSGNQIFTGWEAEYISERKFPNLNIIDLEGGGSETKIKAVKEISGEKSEYSERYYR